MADLLYRNRRLLVLVLLLIVATGLFALEVLPRQEDPSLTTRYALVLTALPGGSAERVEALVTERIEREVLEMPEVKEVASTSRAGMSVVSVELRDDIRVGELDAVWSRVRDRLSDLEPAFPRGTSAPDLQDRELVETYTLIAALRWAPDGTANYAVLRRLAEDLRDAVRDVPGTGYVKVFGAPEEEIRLELDRRATARLGLTAADVADRVRSSDAKVTAGLVRSAHGDIHIEVSGELDSLERIRNLTLGVGSEGQTLCIRDIARLEKGLADPPDELALIDGHPGVAIAARMQAAERTDRWAARVRTVLDEYRADLPAALELELIFDQSRYVEARLEGLFRNFLLGMACVVVVTFLLMGWRSAVVVGLTLPLASLMVFSGLELLDIPIHQMSVMGLIVALGMLIDNAIIMTDEVGHAMRSGVAPSDAIRKSVRHLAVPLLGSTLTTILAFMPLVLLPGATGEFVGSIGISVSLAISSSFVLGLTVVPALVALLGPGQRGPLWLRAGLAPGLLARPYRWALRWMFSRPITAILFAAALPLVGFLLWPLLPEQFFPPAERDHMRIEVELPAQASIAQTRRLALEMDALLGTDPQVREVHWFLGRNAPKYYYNMMSGREGSANFAEAYVKLRSSTKTHDHVRTLQKRLDAAYPEALILVRPLEQGEPYAAPVELRIFGPDLEELQRLGEEARRILASIEDVTQTRTSIAGSRPKLHLQLDEPSLRRTGLGNTDVAAQLHAALEGVGGGTLLEGTEELHVNVRLEAGARSGLDDLASIDLLGPRSSTGRPPVPLSAVGRLALEPEEGAISRRDGRRLNTVQAFITAGVLPSVVLDRAQRALDAAGFEVPTGYRLAFGGEQEGRDKAVGSLMASVSVLVLLMLTVLVLSFGSFRLAGLILTIGALSIGLGLLALFVFGQNFGFMAIAGTMGLVGLAINDSIAVLAGLRKDERVRAGDIAATENVVFRSTRHVLSTTLTTIAGFMPLILSGGNLWPPLAISIAGGVVGATFLALFFLPAAHRAFVAVRVPSPDAA